MIDKNKPKTVKVTVYSARNLRQKKGEGEPLAWAVFGFGKDKCCTAQVADRYPKWNEESTFTLPENNKLPLKFNIKDKEDVIGQIVIPIADLPSDDHFLKWVPLGAHKKHSNPQGEICIDCWIHDYYGPNETIPSGGKGLLNKTINKIKGPELPRRFLGERFMTSGLTSIKGSVSVENLSSSKYKKIKKENNLSKQIFYTEETNGVHLAEEEAPVSKEQKRMSIPDMRRTTMPEAKRMSLGELPVIKEQCYPPKISSIVPTSGPCSGGTLIQITGKHLGTCRDDIVRLMVAGCNCIEMLEYYTPNKIICHTQESYGTGPISIQTRSGGMSSSKVMFEFVDDVTEAENNNHLDPLNTSKDMVDSSTSPKLISARDMEVEQLKSTVEVLSRENGQLREYIDKLVVYLMDKYPDALDSSKMYNC